MKSNKKLVFYIGGFAPMGGIEGFARDFLVEVAEAFPERTLIYWGKRPSLLPLVGEVSCSEAEICRSFFRWGCRWNLPDYVLLPKGLRVVEGSSWVVFKRPPPLLILRALRKMRNRRDGSAARFLLITPYRPSEYWRAGCRTDELEFFDAIVVQSEDWKAELRDLGYRGRIEAISYFSPNVETPLAFPFENYQKKIRIGFLGRFEDQKNLPYLLESYQILLGEYGQKYELHMFGDGSKRLDLESLSKEIGGNSIYFHGALSRDGVNAAIDSCDLFVNPSTTEGQCLTALEVLSRGRPLVATPVGALPDILSDKRLGRIASLGDAVSFAAAIQQTTAAIRSGAMTPQGIQSAFLERFDRNTIRARYVSLLESMIVG